MAVEMFFMTKSPRKNVPDVGIELGAACMPSGLASDRATVPGRLQDWVIPVFIYCNILRLIRHKMLLLHCSNYLEELVHSLQRLDTAREEQENRLRSEKCKLEEDCTDLE